MVTIVFRGRSTQWPSYLVSLPFSGHRTEWLQNSVTSWNSVIKHVLRVRFAASEQTALAAVLSALSVQLLPGPASSAHKQFLSLLAQLR